MKNTYKIEVMEGFPCTESGIEKGVSAPFAGILNEHLIVAGGCNFPEKPVSEGGTKRFYKGIYAALITNNSCLSWEKIADLPQESAYGVSLTHKNTLYFIGGSNEKGGLSAVYSLTLQGEQLAPKLQTLPSLPCAIDNMAGAVVNNCLIVVGGIQNNVPSANVYMLSLDNIEKGWTQLATLPSTPRVQPVCGVLNNQLCVFGGFYAGTNGIDAVVYTDGLMLNHTTKEWTSLGSIGLNAQNAITTTGAAMVNILPNTLLLAGGVNKELFLDAISGAYKKVKKENYLLQPVEWYKFNNHLYSYSLDSHEWTKTNLYTPHLARAGAAMVVNKNHIYYIGGELKPGIRSAQVSRISFK